jgi:hypothetical protein
VTEQRETSGRSAWRFPASSFLPHPATFLFPAEQTIVSPLQEPTQRWNARNKNRRHCLIAQLAQGCQPYPYAASESEHDLLLAFSHWPWSTRCRSSFYGVTAPNQRGNRTTREGKGCVLGPQIGQSRRRDSEIDENFGRPCSGPWRAMVEGYGFLSGAIRVQTTSPISAWVETILGGHYWTHGRAFGGWLRFAGIRESPYLSG